MYTLSPVFEDEFGGGQPRHAGHLQIRDVVDQVRDARLVVDDAGGIRIGHNREESLVPDNDEGKTGLRCACGRWRRIRRGMPGPVTRYWYSVSYLRPPSTAV